MMKGVWIADYEGDPDETEYDEIIEIARRLRNFFREFHFVPLQIQIQKKLIHTIHANYYL